MGEKKGDEINTHVGQSTHQKILSQQKMCIMGVAIFSPKRERWTQKSSSKERHEVLLTKRVGLSTSAWMAYSLLACIHLLHSRLECSIIGRLKGEIYFTKIKSFPFPLEPMDSLAKAKTSSKDFDRVLPSAFFVDIITYYFKCLKMTWNVSVWKLHRNKHLFFTPLAKSR